MALPYRERMEREISRLEAARARLVRGYRRGPGDVRIGKGEYVAGAELDRYQRLGRELAAVQLRLDDAVTGPPSAAELPGLLARAVAERDHLAAIPRTARTTGQTHALWLADCRVSELEAAAAVSGPRSDGEPAQGGDHQRAAVAAAGSAPHIGAGDQVAATSGRRRVPVTEAQAAVVGFRFLDNDDPAGIVLDGATMTYPLERGAYIVETLEFYAEQLRYNPGPGLEGHQERRSTLALARKVREANAAAAAVSGPRSAGKPRPGGHRRGAAAAAAGSAAQGGAAGAGDPPETSPGRSGARTGPSADVHTNARKAKRANKGARTVLGGRRHLPPHQHPPAVDVDDQVAELDAGEGWGPWRIALTHPDEPLGEGCQPTVESRSRRVDDPAATPHLAYRGACLRCDWRGPAHLIGGANAAVEDAHDHSHPGWRSLPVVERVGWTIIDSLSRRERGRQADLRRLTPLMPADWLQRAGPIRAWRDPQGTRHVPGYSPFGGYELAVVRTAEADEPGGQVDGLDGTAPATAWGIGDRVLIANAHGEPNAAEVMAENPARPSVLKVKYLASRTAAWVARSRVLGPAAPPTPVVEPDDQVADVVTIAPVAEELGAAPAGYPADQHPARTYLGRLAPAGRRSQATGLGRIAGFLSGGRLAADELPWHLVRYQHVQRVRAWLADEAGLSPATANAYLAGLRGVVTECWRLGYLSAEDRSRALDFKRVTGDRLPRGRALTRGEMVAVFDGLDVAEGVTARRDAALIAVMYSGGGVRRTELVRLDLVDVDLEACELRVRSGKGRKDRLVHLGPEACAALADWLDVRGLVPGPLFLPVAKDRRTLRQGARLDPTTVRLACQRRSASAGVATFSPHDLRRTSISDLLDLTGDLALVSRMAGHASPSTTRRYDRRPVEAERRAARSLHVPYRSRRRPAR